MTDDTITDTDDIPPPAVSLDSIHEKHIPSTADPTWGVYCRECLGEWPCDVTVLFGELDRLYGKLVYASYAGMASERGRIRRAVEAAGGVLPFGLMLDIIDGSLDITTGAPA